MQGFFTCVPDAGADRGSLLRTLLVVRGTILSRLVGLVRLLLGGLIQFSVVTHEIGQVISAQVDPNDSLRRIVIVRPVRSLQHLDRVFVIVEE